MVKTKWNYLIEIKPLGSFIKDKVITSAVQEHFFVRFPELALEVQSTERSTSL